MRILAVAAALLVLASPPPDPRALQTYERGKQAYDAHRYDEALQRFDEAVRLQPDLARWHYNRGLALRKLGREVEMRAALERSRTLDPDYKREEIAAKLGSGGLAEAAEGTTAASDSCDATGLACGVFLAGAAIALALHSRFRSRSRGAGTHSTGAREQRLYALSARLGTLERRFAQGEDPEARTLLERATAAERRGYALLPRVLAKPKKSVDLEAALLAGEGAAQEAQARLSTVFGPASTQPAARVGCWFCARPLANPEARVPLVLAQGQEEAPALVCPDCAAQAEAGRPPRVLVVAPTGRDPAAPRRVQHWSEVPEFDPYLHRHRPFPGARPVGLHALQSSLSTGELAALAAGGALAAGAAALVASQVLDLDALSQTAAAEFTARGGPSDRESWADHS